MIVLHHQYVWLLHFKTQTSVADVKKTFAYLMSVFSIPYALANLNIIA